MNNASLKHVQELINKDIERLEKSNLRGANKEKYDELKNDYSALSRKIFSYQNSDNNGLTINPYTTNALFSEFAKISANFDFYMSFMEGYKEVETYQINKVKNNLTTISNKLNKDNLKEVEDEFKNAINLYKNILAHAIEAQEIKEIINSFNYRVYKYKIDKLTIDTTLNQDDFISFVLNDINTILEDNEVSLNIKNELQKYILDVNLIKDNFNKIIILINLGFNKKNLSKEEIENELNQNFYKEISFKLPSVDLTKYKLPEKRVSFMKDIEKIGNATIVYDEEFIGALACYIGNNSYDKSDILELVNYLKNIPYLDNIRYLCESILIYTHGSVIPLTWIIEGLKKIGNRSKSLNDVLIDIDSAVIAHLDIIDDRVLLNYLTDLDNHSLIIEYLLKNNNEKYNNVLMDYALYCHDEELLNKLSNYIKENGLDYNRKELLINYFLDSLKKEDFNRLVSYHDANLIVEVLERFADRYNENGVINDLWSFVNLISNKDLKKQVMDLIYSNLDNKNNDKKLYLIIRNTAIDESLFNPFVAYEYSKFHSKFQYPSTKDFDWIKLLVKPYGMYKLDYKNLHDIFKISYLDLVMNAPVSISYFLKYLDYSDIVKLPEETLDIFCYDYETKLKVDNLSLSDKISAVMGADKGYEEKELLTYIMHKGLINDEIMMYYHPMNFNNHPIYKYGLKRNQDKMSNVSYIAKMLGNREEFKEYSSLFLTDKELEDFKNDNNINEEKKDLKLRKYYWDLIRLMDKVSNDTKLKIVVYVAKSNLKEHITYIKIHYKDYIEILLNNVTDESLQLELMKSYEEYILNEKGRS